MADRLTISVVVPHLNQPAALARCLAGLAAQTDAPDEVIVVDNGSQPVPSVAPLAAICPAVQLLREAEPGPGPARNTGAAVATGAVLAFIDADCRPDPGWIAAIRAGMSDPRAEILGGDVRIDMADPVRPGLWEAYEAIYAYRMDRYIAREGYTGTGNLAVRRPVFDAVGPFAGIGRAEDRDWGQRATAAGHDLRYMPQMRVYHPARAGFAELAQKWDRHIAHEFAAADISRAARLRLWLKAAALPVSIVAELPRVVASDRITGLRARALALAGLARIRMWRAGRMVRHLLRGGTDRVAARWNRPG